MRKDYNTSYLHDLNRRSFTHRLGWLPTQRFAFVAGNPHHLTEICRCDLARVVFRSPAADRISFSTLLTPICPPTPRRHLLSAAIAGAWQLGRFETWIGFLSRGESNIRIADCLFFYLFFCSRTKIHLRTITFCRKECFRCRPPLLGFVPCLTRCRRVVLPLLLLTTPKNEHRGRVEAVERGRFFFLPADALFGRNENIGDPRLWACARVRLWRYRPSTRPLAI